MLSFVDQTTNVKVFRVARNSEGQLVRERLGLVKKKDFSLDEDLQALDINEKSDIAALIEFYRQGSAYDKLAALYRMPIMLREAVDHVTTVGTRMERDVFMMALVEALRLLKKADREKDEVVQD